MNKPGQILVINSPLFRFKNEKYDEDSLPPIGLGIIATSIANHGLNVKLIDAVAENIPLEELIRQIKSINPVFICINIFSTNLILVKELVETTDIHTHWVIGGLATNDLKREIFTWNSNCPIDVVHGDGEKIIIDIIQDTLVQQPAEQNDQTRYFQVTTNSPYYVSDISIENLNRSFFSNEPINHPFGFKEATIITSRGCIYNCSFCAAARSVNSSLGIREKNVTSIVNEIENLIQLYPGLQSVRILDDLFLKSSKTIDKAISIFKNIPIKWRAMAHVETFSNVDESKILELKNSGCDEIFIGLESGSPRILKQLHKTTNIEKIKKSVTLLLKNGIKVKGYFIYGFPNETKEDFEMTFQLAEYFRDLGQKFNIDFRTSVFQYRPYHGTELYRNIEDNKIEEVNTINFIEPNTELSSMIGRLQFNFHNGNYSNESMALVHEFIARTTFLDSLRIFGSHPHGEPNEKLQ